MPGIKVVEEEKVPETDAVELVKRVKTEQPGLAVLVHSMHAESPVASRMLKAGASGYITKDSEPEQLVGALRKVAGGGRYIGAALAERLPVDRDVLGDDAELGALARLLVDLRRAQHGLGRDAGVVEAAPPRLVALDHGGLLAQLGGADRGDVPTGAPADDDHVEGICHGS